MKKKAFTILELVIVLMMISALAIIGLNLYLRSDERAKGSEAKTVLGNLRKFANSFRFTNGTLVGISANDLSIGSSTDQIPDSCRSTHYFEYSYAVISDTTISLTATRCTAAGKIPNYRLPGTLVLSSNLSSGSDSWSGNGGY